MRLHPFDQFLVERMHLPRHTECAVTQMPARASCDLPHFGGRQVAELIAIELAVLREGDMIHIQVEPHADGIGRHQEIHVAGLVKLHLRIARARAERAHDHCRPAALTADQFGNRVNLVGGKGDDGGTVRQAGNLLGTGIGQMRQARTRNHIDAAQKLFQNPAHGSGTKQQRLLPPPQMQDAVGEDMATLKITSKLHLIDGHESGIGTARHGLDRADGIACAGRHDLFLARHQRNIGRTNPFHDAVIDLARQKAQRQADHATSMRQHAFNGEMRLAGVGRPKHGGHIAATQGQRQIMGRELVHANNRIPGTSALHGLDAGSAIALYDLHRKRSC